MSDGHHSSGAMLVAAVVGYLAPFGGHTQFEDFAWRVASALVSAALIGVGNWLAKRWKGRRGT